MARSVELLDVNKRDHAMFLYDLLVACKDEFLDDYENDIIAVIDEYHKRLEHQGATAFLCLVNGQKAGIIGVSDNGKHVGELLAALHPQFRDGLGRHAYRFMEAFVSFCFDSLDYRKLRTLNFISNQRVEKLLRHYGFRKAGLHYAETMKDGKPATMVELYMTKSLYEGRKK